MGQYYQVFIFDSYHLDAKNPLPRLIENFQEMLHFEVYKVVVLHNLIDVLVIFSTEFVEKRHKDVVVHVVGDSLLVKNHPNLHQEETGS